MGAPAKKASSSSEDAIEKVIVTNRRAQFDYAIDDKFEGGLVLVGSEVKSMRAGKVELVDAYASVDNGELWLKQMKAIGLRIRFEPGMFGELAKNSLAGKLQMWSFAWSAAQPDGDFFLALAYGPNAGQSNDSRFSLPAYDRLYERQRALPDGPERLALMREAQRLLIAYAPLLPHSHALRVDLTQAGVVGYRRLPFTRDWWRYTALD